MAISEFTGKYRFLSNFWFVQVEFEGYSYTTVEHAYQAAKSLDQTMRDTIRQSKLPSDAKRLGNQVQLRPDWDSVKRLIMLNLLRNKFNHIGLRSLLLQTNDQLLIEGNTWHDNYWGVCFCAVCNYERSREEPGLGKNWLGKLLMHVRFEIAC